MKKLRLLIALVCLAFAAASAMASDLNITPAPASVRPGAGTFTLTKGLTVSTHGQSKAMAEEATKFVRALNAATGLEATTTGKSKAAITIATNPALAEEGYILDIKPTGISIQAATPTGLFYAFQTIKKLLPANVMAGVADPTATYTLPEAVIADEPRFGYRGFMLDVSRHFFDANELKKMIDLMAAYKLNRFHWHLTDDQGWRLPVPKYPKLTEEGATNRNILRTDFDAQRQWRAGLDSIYGPFAYTTDEIREIVDYARERHIEVIPEIDMPGHMVAAIHAYPEFSTDPESRLVPSDVAMDSEPIAGQPMTHFTHNMWNVGGVSKDVLDVSKPEVMTFVKDVVDVLAELFPYEYIHIGGDECPTIAWEKSESCQALKKELGLESDHALQSWFTKQIADYASEKHGKKIMGWNELITEGGADLDMLKTFDPIIFCWFPPEQAVSTAQANGFKHVYTPFNGGYYINRSYRGHDKVGAVGDGSLAVAYNVNPPTGDQCVGVQGTFWTEQVDRPRDLEYLALPRLIAVAEQGWSTPAAKSYERFMERLAADTVYLNLGGYNYGRHQITDYSACPKPDANKWYKVVSAARDDRGGSVWELLTPESTFTDAMIAAGAAPTELWTATDSVAAANPDTRLFRFVEDPAHPGRYAIICKAQPSGSLYPGATENSTAGRWVYYPTLTYGFELDRSFYDPARPGEMRYAFRAVGAPQNYLNAARDAQGRAVNVYSNPAESSAGIFILK